MTTWPTTPNTRATSRGRYPCRRANTSRSSLAWMPGSTFTGSSDSTKGRRTSSGTPAGWSLTTPSARWPSASGLLGTQEIILIHHTDCGMLTFTDDDFKRTIQDETGVKPPWAAEAFPDLEAGRPAVVTSHRKQSVRDQACVAAWVRLRRRDRQARRGHAVAAPAVIRPCRWRGPWRAACPLDPRSRPRS